MDIGIHHPHFTLIKIDAHNYTQTKTKGFPNIGQIVLKLKDV